MADTDTGTKLTKLSPMQTRKIYVVAEAPIGAQISNGGNVQIIFPGGYTSFSIPWYDIPKVQRLAAQLAIEQLTDTVPSASGSGKGYKALTIETREQDGQIVLTLGKGGPALTMIAIEVDPAVAPLVEVAATHGGGFYNEGHPDTGDGDGDGGDDDDDDDPDGDDD